MVGRLVKEKHIRLGKKDLCKLDTHVPTLAERLCRTLKFFIFEAKTDEGLLRHYLRIV